MRLAPFIAEHTETILAAWEAFARATVPGRELDSLALRDHAADLLSATVRDMHATDTEALKAARVYGYPDGSDRTMRLNGASEEHAIGRLGVGFDLMQLVSEYRALRASVLSLWHASEPATDERDVGDLALFNASIDQSMATAVRAYTRRMDESRDMFLAILSHDLRNPLNSIKMSAQLLPQIGHLDAQSSGFAHQISTSASVMARMISDLLDYTRTRLGAGMPIDVEPMDLGVVADDVVTEFRVAHPKVTMNLETDGDLGGTWDPARLRQVISNLLGNAIQHGDPRQPIGVRLEAGASEVWVAIHNSGPTIPAAELPKIFDPLVRGAGSTTPRKNRPGSIGLGLYIARELVLAHGGSINVSSTVDDGTIFAFHVPRLAHDVPLINPGESLAGK